MRYSLGVLVCVVAFGLAGCGNPLGTPADQPVRGLAAEAAGLDADGNPPQAVDDSQVLTQAALVPPSRRGLFGMFVRNDPEPAPTLAQANVADEAAANDESVEAGVVDVAAAAGLETMAETDAPPVAAAAPVAVAAADPPRRGLFAGLFGGGRTANPGEGATAPLGAANAAPAPSAPPDQVAKGTVLPFGAVATVCGLTKRELGKEVDEFPREGRAQWQLHDPIPDSTGPRTQFITGFRDRCARQVTGALVLFGNADVHETTRYAKTNSRAFNATDNAYEKIKSRLCGVRPKVPCPADRYERLTKSVSFVTVYARFGATREWYELLLVDGQLEAAAMSGL